MAALVFVGLLVFFAAAGLCAGGGSCRDAGLCCDGRNGSCVVVSGFEKPCYCDHACLKVEDCCRDFQDVCGVVDCQVSEWGPWSGCGVECGIGAMTRKRHTLREDRNGGKGCPELTQKRSCYGSRCEGKTHIKANRETAMILQATYSPIRRLNATQDIRNNLRLRYRKDPAEESSKDYCVVFEVTKSRHSCETLGGEIGSLLAKKGAEVCVACEMAAMRRDLGYRCTGHGVDHKATRFAFLAHQQCHGRWKRKAVADRCPCQEDGKAHFIFV